MGGHPDILVQEAYRKNNYKIVDIPKGTNICYIFFSSNGIYYPNTKSEFEDKIIIHDRFEWENLAKRKEMLATCDKQIFVRDIYKQWYVRGVNEKVDTVDKLVDLLRSLTNGFEVVTVGISAGGYMAALVAAKLNAKRCYDFSGQVSLWEEADRNPFLKLKGDKDIKSKWYNILDVVKSSSCCFYYFYASGCEEDCYSWNLLRECPNVYGFGFPWKKHAATCFTWNMPYVLIKGMQEMNDLAERYENRKINPLFFSFRTMPFDKAIYYPVRKIVKVFVKAVNADRRKATFED